MGVVHSIDFDSFPKQSDQVGKRVTVVFKYDVKRQIGGVVVRDDIEEPFRTIFRLDDERHVLAIECQYALED